MDQPDSTLGPPTNIRIVNPTSATTTQKGLTFPASYEAHDHAKGFKTTKIQFEAITVTRHN